MDKTAPSLRIFFPGHFVQEADIRWQYQSFEMPLNQYSKDAPTAAMGGTAGAENMLHL